MNRRSTLHIFAVVLCVLALCVSQIFGSKVGYYCLCGGKPVPTQASYCYGPHSEKCAEDEAQGGASKNDNGAGDRREHQVVNQDVQLRPVEAAKRVIAQQVLLAVLPMVEIIFDSQQTKVPAICSVDFGESPPFGVTVARTIVLLI